MQRNKPLNRKRSTPRRSQKRDLVYLAKVREMACAACDGRPAEPHHPKDGLGMGVKAPDRDAFPLCAECHRSFHLGVGRFAGWTREQKKVWQFEKTQETQYLIEKAKATV